MTEKEGQWAKRNRSLWLGLLIVGTASTLSGCRESWSEEQATRLRKACITGTTLVNDPAPVEFCQCIVPMIQKNFSPEALDSLEKDPVKIAEVGSECRIATNEVRAEWTDHSIRSFLNSCEKLAKEDGITQAGYCDCILEKVRKRYVTTTRMDAVTHSRLRAIGRECIGKK